MPKIMLMLTCLIKSIKWVKFVKSDGYSVLNARIMVRWRGEEEELVQLAVSTGRFYETEALLAISIFQKQFLFFE